MSNNSTGANISLEGPGGRAMSLVLMQVIIVFGNLLILLACKTFKIWTVPDILIASLAIVDFLNGLGPVLISVSMYYIHPLGFNGVPITWLCHMYSFLSGLFRTLAFFIASCMALDRLFAIAVPLKYKVILTNQRAICVMLILFALSAVISSLPLFGVTRILPFGPICSFEFTSSFALFIAFLGYFQLILVVSCYIGVIKGIRGFLSRQGSMKRNQLRASVGYSVRTASRRMTPVTKIEFVKEMQLNHDGKERLEVDNFKPDNNKISTSDAIAAQTLENQRKGSIQGSILREGHGNTANLVNGKEKKKLSVTFALSTKTMGDHLASSSPAFKESTNTGPIGQPTITNDTIVKDDKGTRVGETDEMVDVDIKDVNDYELKRKRKFAIGRVFYDSFVTRFVEQTRKSSAAVKRRLSLSSAATEEDMESVAEIEIRQSLKRFKKESTAWKNSKKLALVMGIVVFLFYCSWMPIVICITISLTTGRSTLTLQFIAARMSLFSSMMNVFVYGLMLKQYRGAYRKIFTFLIPRCYGSNRVTTTS